MLASIGVETDEERDRACVSVANAVKEAVKQLNQCLAAAGVCRLRVDIEVNTIDVTAISSPAPQRYTHVTAQILKHMG